MFDSQKNKKDDQSTFGRVDVDTIYPTPKTSEQRHKERQARNVRRLARQPRYVVLSTSLQMYAIWLGLALAVGLTILALRASILSGVLLSFSIGLSWFGFAIWMLHEVLGRFEKLGYDAKPFLLLYVCIFPVLAFISYELTSHLPVATFLTLATGGHFLIVYVLLRSRNQPEG